MSALQKNSLPDLELFNQSGPYYTSYPILSEWQKLDDDAEYRAAIMAYNDSDIVTRTGIYIHFPFCRTQCLYCACNACISSSDTEYIRFLNSLHAEIELLLGAFHNPDRIFRLVEIHFGGGSPSLLGEQQLRDIINKIGTFLDLDGVQDFSIEVDPRTVTPSVLGIYRKIGINRLSFGVQEFDPQAQKAINRIQPFELVEELCIAAKDEGFASINFDILYGLPLQTHQSFMTTINKVIQLAPDRVSLIRYAHIPDSRPHQRALDKYAMPSDKEKALMFFDATEALVEAGWEHIGIDHFAKPVDSLAVAERTGGMTRNFGGYSAAGTEVILGLGPTATTRLGPYYAQNCYSLEEYYSAVSADKYPVHRGYALDADALLRREVIMTLLCQYKVDFERFGEHHNLLFTSYFAEEYSELCKFADIGFLELSERGLLVTPKGRFFLRHYCKIFDKVHCSNNNYVVAGP
jgi:oxygen-independent coproporphyrinogen III oxidase